MSFNYLLPFAGACSLSVAFASPADQPTDEIIVHGRGLELIGEAAAASEGIVGYADFEDRLLSRVGELVEVIPGVIATQHSGEGKANQYFLRGFNLDHGTDFSASVDGVPVNMRTHGHGQGYLDLNFVIPELVERVDYRKGPYRADTGDFSSAGSARFSMYDRLDRPFAEIQGGEFGYLRGVTAGSWATSENGDLILGLEVQRYDGPWELDQDLTKINGYSRWTRRFNGGHLHIAATAYDSEWTSTDQIPLRAVEDGLIGRFGNVDDDLGGASSRYSVSGSVTFNHDADAWTEVSGYAVASDFELYSNFTYFLEDDVNGDEFEQRDERAIYGASITHHRLVGERLALRFGAETRYDDISDLGLYHTAERQRLDTIRHDSVEELSAALWGEAVYELTPTLRGTLGLRADWYDADVTAESLSVNSGSASDEIVSPSVGLAWQAAPSIELYANYGQGFHSNDVRGATITVDPVSGDPADQVPILVRSTGSEIGARWENGPVKATLAAFHLELDSELVFVGDAGATEPNDGSVRTGVEAALFWQPVDWLALDASAAFTDAEFDIPGSDTSIPGAVETVVAAGAVARFDPLTLSLRLRHLGEAPLIEDDSVRSEATTLVNAAATYDIGRAELGVEVLNLFDAEDADITYFYESQLPGEMSPVEDIHFHPVESRQVRVSLRYSF